MRAEGLDHYVPTACLTRVNLARGASAALKQAIREDKSLLKVSFFFFFGKSSLCGLTVDQIM